MAAPTLAHPGVYVQEQLLPPPIISDPQAPPQAMVGTHPRGPAGWTLVTSWNRFVSLYGGFAEGRSDLALAAYTYFAQGASNLYVRRVVSGDATVADATLTDGSATNALVVEAANPGAWGSNTNVTVAASSVNSDYFDLQVFYGGTGAGNLVETWSYLTMDPTDERYAPGVVNPGSNYVRLVDPDTGGSNPAPVTNEVLDGTAGSNGTAPTAEIINAAVADLDSVPEPLVVAAPGITDVAVINPLIAYAEEREDLFVVLDPPATKSVDDVIAYADTLTQSSYWAMYWPRVVMTDPSTSNSRAEIEVAPSGAAMGVYSRTDLQRSLYTAPAGSQARLNGIKQPVVTLTDTQAGRLNNAHINAVRAVRGQGTLLYGARTGRRTLQIDRYVPARRTLIALKRQAREAIQFALFENNDRVLRNSVETSLRAMLYGVFLAGGLAGDGPETAFYVKCDDENNTFDLVRQGILTVELGVALQAPAEFIVITIAQTSGGATANETLAV